MRSPAHVLGVEICPADDSGTLQCCTLSAQTAQSHSPAISLIQQLHKINARRWTLCNGKNF